MVFRVNHIHLKAPDPKKTADWYVKAFNVKIVDDSIRATGERFIRCASEDDGLAINISAARAGDAYNQGDAGLHFGLEHFGFDSTDLDADIERLVSLGAKLLDGPHATSPIQRIAFVEAPDNVRIELIQRSAPQA